MIKVAILVDGAFYLKRAKYLWGEKKPQERADELITYCLRHLQEEPQEKFSPRMKLNNYGKNQTQAQLLKSY